MSTTFGYYSGWTLIGDYRADAEFYRPEHQEYFSALRSVSHRELGAIATMRRPQYRTTTAFDPGVLRGGIKFLSPTEVETQFVDWAKVREVSPTVWDDYPSGRAAKGDLLLEVKGDATKVFLLGESTPTKAMVSGSFQQIRLNESRDVWFVFAAFLSNIWQRQRQRLQSNINIKYVDKEALRSVILPWPDRAIRESIGLKVHASEKLRMRAVALWNSTLESASRLWDGLLCPTQSAHSSTFLTDGFSTRRIDADYYKHDDLVLRQQLVDAGFVPIGEACETIESGSTPREEGEAVRVAGVGSIRTPALKLGRETYKRPSSAMDLRVGDVLVCNAAHDARFIGRQNAVVGENSDLVASSEVLVCRPANPGHSLPIVHFLNTRFGYAQLQRAVRGMTAHLYAEDMSEVLVPPAADSVAENEIHLRALTDAWRRSERLIESAIEEMDALVEGRLDDANCIQQGRQLAEEFGLEESQ